MKFSIFATIIGLALIGPAMGCSSGSSAGGNSLFALLNAILELLRRILQQLDAQAVATTTTTTTTTTRAPSPCEIKRDQLLASNPQGRHVPVCMAGDGAYRPDQYQPDGVNFCYDVEGEKIEGSVVNDGAQSGRYNECLAMRSYFMINFQFNHREH